ncbi:uncharacterized protein M421DRAFT_149708 [Didymella exigua CBS 183.55]|uniref:Tcp11-domain-containing protein n=1 Tax=Didymella exigua CBS 183.55 TaxID=1150837 RepID=A0A6A5RQK2_9PLEO|nr:uncharacterized protein M421DRAFT_149708 [Didymella exigua CBS 183.55]KAF1928586.1 hypothetical protein M421DRAFT_149708 [Didymella exigua CBS 183.55]
MSFSDSEIELVSSQLQLDNDGIPEEPDMLLSDDAGNDQTFAPPPRIAARFYRYSNNRRKSSATSSRRNSLSSTHSHTSSRSAIRNSCQSHHIAQHLRRVSILETRKARLADRAAHAEQVRLRAAAAKATPRVSNSEEKALAAKEARERHLAQVAASCAEEVRRAKKIAEDMKERKAAEERRYRLEMEEKHAEAERRRLEYKRSPRRPRTASSPPADVKNAAQQSPAPTSEDAAKRIQSAWRARTRKNIVDEWLEIGLSIEKISSTSFEDITAMLADEKLLKMTEKVMELFVLLPDPDPVARSTAVRTFLSSYLILGHPANVLSRDGDQEQDLITKAKDLVLSFESALGKLTTFNYYTPSPTRTETVLLAHSAFVTAFNDWKARDSSALVETMVASFVSLDEIWQSVKDATVEEVANEYRTGIRDNQAILLSRIKKLAGPDKALTLIRKAIREGRRSRPKKRPAGETVRPRVAVDVSVSPVEGESAAMQAEAASELAASGQAAIVGSATQGHQAQSLSKVFTIVPDNRVLVHELSIDKEYRIDASPTADLRDALNRELCDAMRKGFEDGDSAQWTAAMAENIRAKLLRLLKAGNSMHTLISETLDPNHITKQCSQGLFSYEKFFGFIANILPKLCAPFRDAQVKKLTDELKEEGELPEMVEKLFKLLHVIDLLSLDYSNFLLMNAAPTLIKEATGYEQRMFAQDLEEGNITLDRTRRWWRSAAINMHTEADRRDPWAQPNPTNRPTAHKIYARGLIDLAISVPPLRDSELPETLALDRDRISRIREDALRITTIGGILLTAKNLLKRDVRSQWKPQANRMWDVLKDGYMKDSTTPAKISSLLESSHNMPPSTRAQLSSTVTRLLTQAESGKLSDPVTKVLFQRLKTHIFNRVSASSSGERVKAASTATEGLATTGLAEFVPQVADICEQLSKVGEVDRKAHGKWYEEIAEQMENEPLEGEELTRSESGRSAASGSSA